MKTEVQSFGSFMSHHTTGDLSADVYSPQKQIWSRRAGWVATLITKARKKTRKKKKTPHFYTIPGS